MKRLFDGKLKHWYIISAVLVFYDFGAVILSYFLALWLRFDCHFSEIPSNYWQFYHDSIHIVAAVTVIIMFAFRLYRTIWRFASYAELINVFWACLLSGALYFIIMNLTGHRMPISFHLAGIVILFFLTLGIRYSYRLVRLIRDSIRHKDAVEGSEYRKVMIFGAGNAGQMILRDIKSATNVDEKVVCFMDDNPNKWNRQIDGITIVGGRDVILPTCEKYGIEKIYLTIPTAAAADKRDILQICQATDCEVKLLPGMYQLYSGALSVTQMKKVSVEDLLGRDPIKPDMTEVFNEITGKTVMVTGVGSIGSEIARQIASHKPKTLVLFDCYENNAYDIQMELRSHYPELDLHTIIGSVRDSRKLFKVFDDYRPDIVYHAAAHKHVPLMEDSPCEAIKNNAIGTYKTAYAAMTHGCKRFVLISTDKAVNPTNIMGASKRLCEMVIQAFDARIRAGEADRIPQLFTHAMSELIPSEELTSALKNTKTEFVAVRFGNVLGSNGSVIPLFKRQIEAGGPVTVTHPDIIRYFMTIPEAVSLVLLAGTYAHGGEIFVLDMGEPVKIDTLARNLIRLSGYKPDVDIKIVYTGLRPGEKLYEEKLMSEEGLRTTKNKLIHIGQPIPFDVDEFLVRLDGLMEAAYKNKDDICDRVQEVVSTYHPEMQGKGRAEAS